MSDYHDEFFDENRPWSKLKNSILGSYMTPYLAKVNKRPERILLVDAFAGRGKMFSGDPGSPLIICHAANRYAAGKYSALFVNIKRTQHEELTAILDAAGYMSSAKTVCGDGIDQVRYLAENLCNQTLFLYIDPFGLDIEFDVLQPLLSRDKSYSTEILINLNMPGIHRLASRNAWLSGQGDQGSIALHHEKLTRTLGGDYWKDIFLANDDLDTKDRESRLIALYQEQLSRSGYLKYTGACPVREKIDSQTKYYMVFASPHHKAMLLFNDTMCRSFHNFMNDQWAMDTLFADLPWTEWRDPRRIQGIALQYVKDYAGATREVLWQRIVTDHFMLYTESEFNGAIKCLYDAGKIECVTPVAKGGVRPTKRLNKHCEFILSGQGSLF